MFMSISLCMAQTAPLDQTPAQLAEQMVAAISRDVTITAEQQSQLLASATQYYSDLRNAAQSSAHDRAVLYEQFQHTLKNIITEDLYNQWQTVIHERMEQRIATPQPNK